MFLALMAVLLLVVGYSKYENYMNKKEVVKYEDIKTWTYDIRENLKMDFYAKTKLVDGRLYAFMNFDGYPDYLTDERLAYKNSNAYIYINLMDKDGFKLFTKSIPVKEMGLFLNKEGERIGMNYQFDEYFGVDKYKNINQIRVEWTLDTNIPVKNFVPLEVSKAKSLDHCAPGISKSERLRRLSANGAVRQTGYGEYTAGNKSVTMSYDEVISCN